MLLSHLDHPETYETLLTHPVWREVLDWLRALPPDFPEGIHTLREPDLIYVNVHGYETLPREKCRYEAHKRYVDLQYLIQGEEVIEWIPRHELSPAGTFDAEKDVGFFQMPAKGRADLHMLPRHFAIFFHEDAHMPKVQADGPVRLKKLVVKVDRALL
jgi:biofilm protein TabA